MALAGRARLPPVPLRRPTVVSPGASTQLYTRFACGGAISFDASNACASSTRFGTLGRAVGATPVHHPTRTRVRPV